MSKGPLVVVTILAIAAGGLAALTWSQWPSGEAEALPQAVQGRYFDMTVTTSDGREFELPDKEITCPLVFEVADGEGLYDCPSPHDISDLLAPPQVSGDPLVASSAALVEIDAASIFWGFSPNTWNSVQIYYGGSLSSANVLLGPEFTRGESGHIENNVWPDFSRGVFSNSFRYRAKANSSGYMGTEWLVRGTQ